MATRTARKDRGGRGGGTPRVREQRRDLYRQIASEAAERVFALKGSDASRMQDVASEAGLSLATIYGVVEGKEELLNTIHARRMREFIVVVREARDAAATTLDAHRAVLEQSARFFMERPDFLRLCCRDGYAWGSGLTTTETQAEVWEESVSIPTELFRHGIEEGVYVDEPPLLLARKMLALQQVELADWAEGGMRADPDAVCARLDSQFLRAFCRPQPDGGPIPGHGSEADSESNESATD
jgi:AcrR family transcriptional regulator